MTEWINYKILEFGSVTITVENILIVVAILLITKLALILVHYALAKKLGKQSPGAVDEGKKYAYQKVLTYLFYFVATILIFQSFGLKLTVLLTGSAALLVGVGIGLQQTFNDLISGFILLTEGSVKKGDIVNIAGIIGTVKEIGIRTSKIETRDDIVMIIPNSKLVVENVINWSHNALPTRFQVLVGVAYSSNPEEVTTLLLKAANQHPSVLKNPGPSVQFKDFGNSSIDFILHFYTLDFLGVDQIKSQLRYIIFDLFGKNEVQIPFPQTDLWIKEMPLNSKLIAQLEPKTSKKH
jgi:small-conductance mechanosensitive channel